MKLDKKFIGATTLVAVLVFSGCGGGSSSENNPGVTAAQKTAVLTTYADIALANYTQALSDAQALKTAIDTFATTPDQTNLDAAKTAWLRARESYGTTEAFRLSNGPIDAEEGFAASFGAPEGQLNAWPLDENMIDYTQDANGSTTSGNIIDTVGVFNPGDTDVNVSTITKEALAALNGNGGDANVATGYHAIEFLLWGQDQDYNSFLADTVTNGATVAGQRPLTDFTSAANADRRLAYLQAAADLLVDDLQSVVNAWTARSGSYREALLGGGENAIDADEALKQIFAGLGVFIKSELANERMAVAVLTPSEEDEHSCFSDNTHRDIELNYEGFRNIIKGEYPKGRSKGTSFYSLLNTSTKADVDTLIATIDTGVAAINEAAATEHFDYQIRSGSVNRQNIVNTKNIMRDMGDKMVDVAADFGISLTEDDVTDLNETKVE